MSGKVESPSRMSFTAIAASSRLATFEAARRPLRTSRRVIRLARRKSRQASSRGRASTGSIATNTGTNTPTSVPRTSSGFMHRLHRAPQPQLKPASLLEDGRTVLLGGNQRELHAVRLAIGEQREQALPQF